MITLNASGVGNALAAARACSRCNACPLGCSRLRAASPFLDKAWKAVREAAALGTFRIHDPRHTYASVAVNGGEDLRVVAGLLGHADMRRPSATRTSQGGASHATGDRREVKPDPLALIDSKTGPRHILLGEAARTLLGDLAPFTLRGVGVPRQGRRRTVDGWGALLVLDQGARHARDRGGRAASRPAACPRLERGHERREPERRGTPARATSGRPQPTATSISRTRH